MLRRPRKLATALITLTCLGLGAVMLVPAALGLHRYVIVSGSMTGTYDRGSLVYDERVRVGDLRVGDVITYAPPRDAHSSQALVTHRIVWAGRDAAGRPAFRTKGDANAAPDPWRFTLTAPVQDRVVASLPYVGYAFAALSIREVRIVLIGIPAVLIGLWLLAGLWRAAGEEAERRRTATAPEPGP